jgi:hypothetical protein
MKKIFIALFSIVFTLGAFAQAPEMSKKEQKQLQKQLKKEQQAEQQEAQAAIVGLMVEHQSFVLEADMLRDKTGSVVNVSSMINFIAIDSISGFIQIGSNSYVGLNGVGGITLEGNVTNYKYSFTEKSRSYHISFSLRTSVGSYDVRMNAYSDGRADATVSSNWPGQLNYDGNLVPVVSSNVYKGTSTY